MDEAKLKADIEEMASEGEWWKSTTPEVIERCIREMVAAGIEQERATEMISGVRWAVAEEYGN